MLSRVLTLTAACFLPSFLVAQDDGAKVSLELNALTPTDTACMASFIATNTSGQDIESAIYEVVLFDTDGGVDRLTLLDFGTLPSGRPRVRQFGLGNLACDDLGQVLINGAQTCTVAGAASGVCADQLKVSSRTEVEVTG
ncbi:hypothetical protein [Donghicola sp. XS_ASV15]|uniref:hypothetical protein n=1 Tax=Donghicola sp. XS_ASV15 TaxID=3241295 RepID=UPI00351362B4